MLPGRCLCLFGGDYATVEHCCSIIAGIVFIRLCDQHSKYERCALHCCGELAMPPCIHYCQKLVLLETLEVLFVARGYYQRLPHASKVYDKSSASSRCLQIAAVIRIELIVLWIMVGNQCRFGGAQKDTPASRLDKH